MLKAKGKKSTQYAPNLSTEGLRKRSMIRPASPQHVNNRIVETNMLLVLACHNNVFDTVICLTQKFKTKSAVTILKALFERNPMKKIPSKLDEK